MTPTTFDKPLRTAADCGVRTLYRYAKYPKLTDKSKDAVDQRGYVESLLTFGELYLPCPNEFNDPFEASPVFSIPRETGDKPNIAAFSKALREKYAPRWRWDEERIQQAERELKEKIAAGTFELGMEAIQAKWRHQFRTQYPMSCFSSKRDNVLMWAYYAASHSGVCVHFDATLAGLSSAWKINYVKRYPEVELPLAALAPDELIRECLVTKAEIWEREQEFRLVDMPIFEPGTERIIGRVLDHLFERKKPQLVKLQSKYVVGLTCGALMKHDAIEALARICYDRNPSIPLWQAKTMPADYSLLFERIRG